MAGKTQSRKECEGRLGVFRNILKHKYPRCHGQCLCPTTGQEAAPRSPVPRKSAEKHTHAQLLELILSLIDHFETPVHFYRVKAQIGIIGNECADAIAKHAALHNDGHDKMLLAPNTDGKPYSHMHWLETEELTRKRSTPNSYALEPKQLVK